MQRHIVLSPSWILFSMICYLFLGCKGKHTFPTSNDNDCIDLNKVDTIVGIYDEKLPLDTGIDSLVSFLRYFSYDGTNTQTCRDSADRLASLVPKESARYFLAQTYKVNSYYYEGDFDRMQQLLKETEALPGLTNFPFEQLRLKYVKMNLSSALGKHDELWRNCIDILHIRPHTPEQARGLKPMFEGTMAQLIVSYIDMDEMEKGFRCFKRLQEENNPMLTTLNRRDLAVYTAYIAFRAGHPDEACQRMDIAMAMPHYNDSNALARDCWYAGEVYSRVASRQKDAVRYWRQGIEMVRDYDHYNIGPLAKTSLGNYYSRTGDFEEAVNLLFEGLRYDEQLHRVAEISYGYRLIADFHTLWGFYDKARHYLGEAIHVNAEKNKNAPILLGEALLGYYRLYKAEGKRDSCLYSLHQAEAQFLKAENVPSILEVHALLGMEQLETPETLNKGIQLLQEVMNDPSSEGLSMLSEVRSALGIGLIRQGKDSEGLPMVLEAIHEMEQESATTVLRSRYAFLGDYYIHKKNWKAAMNIRTRQQTVTDTLFSREKVRAVATARISFDTEKKEQENKLLIAELKLKHRTMLYYILSSILLAVLLTGYILYNHRLKQKNVALAHQISRLGEKAERLRALEKAMTAQTSIKAVVGEMRDNELFTRLESVMAEQQPFLNSDLTRKELADLVGTNERYLADAIKQFANKKTCLEYINDYRLEYAREILRTDTRINIETICTIAGFSSRQTFYRLFKKQFGLTPTEYRQYSNIQ